MKLRGLILGFFLGYFLVTPGARAQSGLANAMLKNLHGKILPFSTITQKDSIVLVCFWATTSDPSITALNAINAHYEKWLSAANFRLMIVSVDEAKTANKVRPLVNMNEWTFDVYTDIHGDLRSALNANNLPESMILRNGKLIYQQSGYEPGSENYLFQKILAVAGGKL